MSQQSLDPPLPPPPLTPPPPPPSPSVGGKISFSSALLFIIVFLAVIFFLSGLLHLLIRFVKKKRSSALNTIFHSNRYQSEISASDAYNQRQLQQLFNLHDSGLDQAFIDALPVFQYKEIVGLKKEPFDCAVCLCEFNESDNLRLLPLCSHAFHIDCIDTWLLSNSTCPLCRGSLYNYTPGIPLENPIYDFQDDDGVSSIGGGCGVGNGQNPGGIAIEFGGEKRVFPVTLGKFKSSSNDKNNTNQGQGETGETSSSNLDTRRCYSMGSYEYVVPDSVVLQVALCPSKRIAAANVGSSRYGLKVAEEGRVGRNESFRIDEEVDHGKRIHMGSKNESFSVSKIWLWSKKDKYPGSSNAHITVDSSRTFVGMNLA